MQGMIPRLCTRQVRDKLAKYPAVAILGPRQCGKTTLAKQFNGMENVSESLAGRLGMVRMSPFILPELKIRKLDDLWLRGGYPDGGILKPAMFPQWQDDYLDALATRDLPNWGLPAKPQQTLRLLHMLAALHGQPLNASQLGASMGLDHKTVLRYCDFLEGAFLIRRLQPYFSNITKRLVKTPRVYWRDSGLLHALIGATGDGPSRRSSPPTLPPTWSAD